MLWTLVEPSPTSLPWSARRFKGLWPETCQEPTSVRYSWCCWRHLGVNHPYSLNNLKNFIRLFGSSSFFTILLISFSSILTSILTMISSLIWMYCMYWMYLSPWGCLLARPLTFEFQSPSHSNGSFALALHQEHLAFIIKIVRVTKLIHGIGLDTSTKGSSAFLIPVHIVVSLLERDNHHGISLSLIHIWRCRRRG